MSSHLVLGPLAVALAAASWLVVQRAWMKRFPGTAGETDALAARRGEHGCGAVCDEPCQRSERARCATGGEEPR